MGKLLKFEFRKLFKSKAFYICAVIPIVLVIFSGISASQFYIDPETGKCIYELDEFLRYTFNSNMIVMISGIFTAIFLCEDDVSGTIKNIYAKGYSRESVFFSKYIVSLVALLIMLSSELLVAFLYGASHFEMSSNNDLFVRLLGQIVVLISYHALFTAISMWLKKTGGAVALNILGPSLVGLILGTVDIILKLKDKLNGFLFSNYWISTFFADFVSATLTTKVMVTAFVGSCIYIAVGIVLGFLASKKNEL